MKYYVEIEEEEHYLLRKEIHRLFPFFLKKDGTVHKQMTNAALRSFLEAEGKSKIFYNSKRGLLQVFPAQDVFDAYAYAYRNSEQIDEDTYRFKTTAGVVLTYYLNEEDKGDE